MVDPPRQNILNVSGCFSILNSCLLKAVILLVAVIITCLPPGSLNGTNKGILDAKPTNGSADVITGFMPNRAKVPSSRRKNIRVDDRGRSKICQKGVYLDVLV